MKSFFATFTVALILAGAILVSTVPEYWGLRTLLPQTGLHVPEFWTLFWANVWFALAATVAGILGEVSRVIIK